MKKLVWVLVLLSFAVNGWSQKICNEYVVHFDKNKHDLTKEAVQVLQSLVAGMEGDLWVEMTGHTDSSNTLAYNQALSERRVKSVQTYLERTYKKGKCTYRIFAVGERKPKVQNSDEAQMAINRRVEVKVAKLSAGKLSFPGRSGSAALVKPSFFKDCSVCNTPVAVNYWGTEEEALAAGMPLIADDGAQLITSGMMELNVGCGGISPEVDCDTVIFVMPGLPPPLLSLWEFDEKTKRWKPDEGRVEFDPVLNVTYLVDFNYCNRQKENGDYKYYPPICSSIIATDSSFDRVHSILRFGGTDTLEKKNRRIGFKTGYNPLKNTKEEIYHQCIDEFESIRSFGKKSDQYWVGFLPADSIRVDEKMIYPETRTFQIDATHLVYQAIPPSDTTVVLKLGKKLLRFTPQLWIKEYEFDIPLGTPVKKRVTYNYLNYPHQLRLMNGRKSVRIIDVFNTKHKFKKKKKLLKVKVR